MKKLLPALILGAMTLSASPLTSATGSLNPPSENLTGSPGQTVVWGIDLKNDTNEFWVITSVQSDYTETGAPGEIPAGPDFFTDYLSVNFLDSYVSAGLALGPGRTFHQGGDDPVDDPPTVGTPGVDAIGLASFAISTTALPGTLSAEIHITYDIYDGNPFALVPGNYLGSDQIDIDTSVTVNASGPTAPEPSTATLIAGALGIWLAARRLTRSGGWGERVGS